SRLAVASDAGMTTWPRLVSATRSSTTRSRKDSMSQPVNAGTNRYFPYTSRSSNVLLVVGNRMAPRRSSTSVPAARRMGPSDRTAGCGRWGGRGGGDRRSPLVMISPPYPSYAGRHADFPRPPTYHSADEMMRVLLVAPPFRTPNEGTLSLATLRPLFE